MCGKRLEKNPDSNDALIAKALAQLHLGNSADASVSLSEATMNAPSDPYLAMIRGWVLKDYRNQDKNARRSFEQVLDMNIDHDNARSYRGFAMITLDRRQQADAWMERVLANADDHDGEINYLGACFYAQAATPTKPSAAWKTPFRKAMPTTTTGPSTPRPAST